MSSKVSSLLTIDQLYFDRAFTILLITFVGVQLWIAPRYSPDTRLFPFVVGIPTVALLLSLIIIQNSKKASEMSSKYTSDIFDFDSQLLDNDGEEEAVGESRYDRRISLLAISGWIVSLFLIIILVGFVIGSFIFLLLYYWNNTNGSWWKPLLYTMTVWAVIMFVFTYVLQTRFYEGVLLSLFF